MEGEMKKTILVVDDEPGLREIVRTNLEWEGYEVVEAADGVEALRLIRERRPDLVVLDVMMPGMNGWEVLQAIEADVALAGTPIVMHTVVADESAVIQGLEMGAVAYLAKPFSPRELVDAVRLVTEDLDARGRDAYRRHLIQRRKQFMQPLHRLFPFQEEVEQDDQ
jgi:DNA-binding response OmpR family regulator